MNEKAKATALEKKNALQVTGQFRVKETMTYDVRCQESRVTIFMTPRPDAEASSEASPGAWRVRACMTGSPADAPGITEWGATRIEALRAVGTAWTSRHVVPALPAFDWEAMAKVLGAVGAV